MEARRRGCGAAGGVLLMRSGKFLCVSLMTMASRGVVWMPPEMPAPGAESRYFWSRPAEIRERAPRPVRGTVEGRRGLAILEPLASRFFFTLRLPQASSTQSRRRRPIITGRCPQAAPDAPRATRAAAARSSTHRCTSPHPALQRRDSCRRRSNSARRTRRSPSPRLLTAPPPPATKQTQRNRHRRNDAGS